MDVDGNPKPLIFSELSTSQLQNLYDELNALYDNIQEPPAWVVPKILSAPTNRNNTGSKICDLLIYAGGSVNGSSGIWIGFYERNDKILAQEVEQLVNCGAPLTYTLDTLPYFLGCFPSREPDTWDHNEEYTPLIHALILRMPIVAEKIIELSKPTDLLIGDPLNLALWAAQKYTGHKAEYKRIVRLLIKKRDNLTDVKASKIAGTLLNPAVCQVKGCKYRTSSGYKLQLHEIAVHPMDKN
jgi:hypothetical protein